MLQNISICAISHRISNCQKCHIFPFFKFFTYFISIIFSKNFSRFHIFYHRKFQKHLLYTRFQIFSYNIKSRASFSTFCLRQYNYIHFVQFFRRFNRYIFRISHSNSNTVKFTFFHISLSFLFILLLILIKNLLFISYLTSLLSNFFYLPLKIFFKFQLFSQLFLNKFL